MSSSERQSQSKHCCSSEYGLKKHRKIMSMERLRNSKPKEKTYRELYLNSRTDLESRGSPEKTDYLNEVQLLKIRKITGKIVGKPSCWLLTKIIH